MTDPRALDRLLVGYLVEGSNEVADRVIDAALEQIERVDQRRPARLPRRLQDMPIVTRLAVAAVIGVVAVGVAMSLIDPSSAGVGTSRPTPGVTAGPTERPTPKPAPTPNIPGLTGVMGVGRQIHTATALDDGRVLVAGGYDNKDGSLASAVLYSAGDDAFTTTGALGAARGYHTSTLLSDGRILIAGGGAAAWVFYEPFLASAELYDPTTGEFGSTGTMASPREAHTATLLLDGRVLIAGGMDSRDRAVDSAELYDPATGTFQPTGSLTTARAFHTATLLSDGRVLVTGGSPAAWSDGTTFRSAEIYDPSTGAFTETGTMTGGRTFHAATLLADGRVLISGGANGYQADLASAEIYDPQDATFTLTGPLHDGRRYHTATLLADGRVLLAGGGSDYTDRAFIGSAELYDPTTGTFSSTGSLADSRTYHAATLLTDGRVLLTGGYGEQAPLGSAEIYDQATGTFGPAGAGR